jgi:hypothetical protein
VEHIGVKMVALKINPSGKPRFRDREPLSQNKKVQQKCDLSRFLYCFTSTKILKASTTGSFYLASTTGSFYQALVGTKCRLY